MGGPRGNQSGVHREFTKERGGGAGKGAKKSGKSVVKKQKSVLIKKIPEVETRRRIKGELATMERTVTEFN